MPTSLAFNIALPCEVEAEINSPPPNILLPCPNPIGCTSGSFYALIAILLNKSALKDIYLSKLKT